MRLHIPILSIGVALAVACSGDEDRTPREQCTDTEQEINEAARLCDPQFGSIDLGCTNFGTGSSCSTIDDYFSCLGQISCDNGTVMLATGCTLGACE